MNAKACARKWQVEAARDGRLIGKDLESALRHRETCAECALEERELSALGHELASLPEVSRDEVSAQRSRQRLLAAHNESVVDPPTRGRAVTLPLTAALTLALAAAGSVLRAQHQPAESRARASQEIVEVHAQAGARWTKHQDNSRIFVDLEDGAAAFEIHPHPGRSVIIRLPDGEVEDMGTVFDVRVAEQHTRHVAVNEGRVSVRLHGRPTISLGAGETWDSEPAPVAPSAAPLDSSNAPVATRADAPQALAATPSSVTLFRAGKVAPQARASTPLQAPAAPATSAQGSPPAPHLEATKAEDDAYLHIVDLLREAKDSEAQARAKDYLLRFPNGFRRIEVLNIATRGARDAGG